MTNDLRTLTYDLFLKFQVYSFKIKGFKEIKEEYLSDKSRDRTYRTLSAFGCSEDYEAVSNFLTPEEKEVELDLIFGPQVGDRCPDLPVYEIATKEPRNLTFSEDDPKVYLIDFWATWSGHCHAPMAHNQEMLEHNPQWQGKAEILCISLDDSTDDVNKSIDENKWDKVTSLWAGPGGSQEEARRIFSVERIPTCVLVKNGKILWNGNPSERNLEDDINELIEGKEINVEGADQTAEDNMYKKLSERELNSKVELARQKIKEFIESNPSLKAPDVASLTTHEITLTSDTISQSFAVVGHFFQKFKPIGDTFFNSIREIFPNVINRIQYEVTYTIERGSHCSLCNNALDTAQIQYLCLFCDPLHYHCEKCHNLPREGKGSAKLAHPHHLYKITKDAFLDDIRINKDNIRPFVIYEEDPINLTHEHIGCDNRYNCEDGCVGSVVGVRFKCAQCPDYDFCEKCEIEWTTNPSESMVTTAKDRGHDPSHIFIVMQLPA